MLLPSALPCDQRAAAVASTQLQGFTLNPAAIISPYQSPPAEQPSIMSPNGLFSTCRRLHQILSVERSCSPAPSLLPAAPIGKPSRLAQEVPLTERKPTRTAPKTPMRRKHKRSRSMAFNTPDDSAEESDRPQRNMFATPIQKRIRLTTPCAPGRRRLMDDEDDSDKENDDAKWTDQEDQQLVDMVLGKLKLSQNDWDECAKTLGKRDGVVVGKRWEGLIGGVVLKKDRRRTTRRTKPY